MSVFALIGGGLIALAAIWVFVGWWLQYEAAHGVDTVVDWGRAPRDDEEAQARKSKRDELQRRQFAVLDRSRWAAASVMAVGVVLIVIAAVH